MTEKVNKFQLTKEKILYGCIILLLIIVAYLFSKNNNLLSGIQGLTGINPTPTVKVTNSSEPTICSRSTPYPVPPEFTRALSIIMQRSEAGTPNKHNPFYNCINIQYADLSQDKADGVFIFDPNSTTEDLKIFVDNSYKSNDDILTSLLLSHELRHLNQFLNYKTSGQDIPCLEKEAQAFYSELVSWYQLNPEEKNSLNSRITLNPNNVLYQNLITLGTIGNNADRVCGQDNDCWNNEVLRQTREMVSNDTFYQKQCSS